MKEKISRKLLIQTITLPIIAALGIYVSYNEGVSGRIFSIVIGSLCILSIVGIVTQKPKWWFEFLKKY